MSIDNILGQIKLAEENLFEEDRHKRQEAIHTFPRILNARNYTVREALRVKGLIKPIIPKLIEIMKTDADIGLRKIAAKSLGDMPIYDGIYKELLEIFKLGEMENELSWAVGEKLFNFPDSYLDIKEILLEMLQSNNHNHRILGLAMIRKYRESSGRSGNEYLGSVSRIQLEKDWLLILRNLVREAKTEEDAQPAYVTLEKISPDKSAERKLFQKELLYKVMYEILVKIQPEIQVQLTRIMELTTPLIQEHGKIPKRAELTNLDYTKELHEATIKELVQNEDIKGEYFELEQVFVKKGKEIKFSLTSSKIAKKYLCNNCGSSIKHEDQTCSTCKEEILKCNVCKLPISFGEEIGICKHCKSKSHLSHLQEWVKIKGKCPTCQKKLQSEEIITLSKNSN